MSKKITDLTALAAAEDDDYFVIQEDSSGLTKKIKWSVLLTDLATYLTTNLDDLDADPVDIAGDLDIGNDLSVGNDLAVANNADVTGTLDVGAKASTSVRPSSSRGVSVPYLSATIFDVTTLTKNTWTEINTTNWTALSSIASDADFIRVRLSFDCAVASPSATVSALVYARDDGAATAVGTPTLIGRVTGYDVGAAGASVAEVTIPITSRKFELRYNSGFTSDTIEMVLVEAGYSS